MAKSKSRSPANAGIATRRNELERRLCSYSLAATAAGVGLLAAAPANAEVVYTPVNVTIARGQLPIDLNADGINDFLLVDNFYTAPRSRFPLLGGRRLVLGGNASASAIPLNGEAAVLNPGAVIGSSRSFQNVHEPRLGMAAAKWVYHGSTGTCCVYFSGNWENVKNLYLGLKFQINGETHYGWARLTVKTFEDSYFHTRVNATLTGYAYETIPDKSILAGDTGGTATAASSNGAASTRQALGMLALGAAGREGWSRRTQQ